MTKQIARQSFHNISMTSMAADNYTIRTVTTVACLAATVAQQDNEAFAGVLAMARFGTANRRHGQKRKRQRLAKKQKTVTKDSDSEEKKKTERIAKLDMIRKQLAVIKEVAAKRESVLAGLRPKEKE